MNRSWRCREARPSSTACSKGATQTKGLLSVSWRILAKRSQRQCVLTYQRPLAWRIAKELGRRGILRSSYLRTQHEVKEGKLTLKKVGTNNNPADLLIKAMNGEKVMK